MSTLPVDPRWSRRRPSRTEGTAARAPRRAGRRDRPGEPALLPGGRAGAQRRRVRRAVPRARRARDRLPGRCGPPTRRPSASAAARSRRRSTRSATGARCCRSPTRSATTSCGRSTPASASGLGLPPAPEPAQDLSYVAELKIDGLAVSPPLRARPFRPGRDARRRHDRRGRHRQPADDRGDPGPAARAGRRRGPGRGLHAQGRVRPDQRRARGGRPAAVREPAQQRRRLAPPEGSGGHREPAPVGLVLPAHRGRRVRARGDRQSAALDRLAGARAPGQPRSRDRARHRRRHRLHRTLARGPPRPRRTRPTGSSSRSIGSTSRSGSGWSPGRRAGRSPTSSRPSRSRRSSRTSSPTSAGPGRSPRSPTCGRSRWPARRSPGRRSTTSTRSAARTSGSATRSSSRRPAT